MGYVDDNLMSGEHVVYQAEIHWIIFMPGVVLLFIGLFLFSRGPEGNLLVLSLIATILAVLSLVRAYITSASTELAVTSKRVIAKFGFIRRNTIELNHSKVESFHVDQGIFGRIFGYGRLVINGTGGGKTPIPNVDSPLVFRRNAMEEIDESQTRRP